jgi:hemolysin activation/secretion protein
MFFYKKPLSQTLAYLLLSQLTAAYALEPGALNPSRPDYQLPLLPQVLPKAPPQNVQIQPEPFSEAITANGTGFVLKTVLFDSADVTTAQKLQQWVTPYIGKTLNRLDLDNLRLDIQQYLIQQGFLYPSVILPSQHISKGILHYQVHTGHLAQINIKGTDGLQNDYVRHRLQPDGNRPLQRAELQDRFQMLLTDPLIERVNANLRPGANPGDAVLDLDVKRAKPYELHIGVDNYTPPTVGAYTGRLDGIVRNLTGWGDFLRVNLSGSEGTQGIGGYFSLPLNAYDTRLNLGYQGSEAEVIDSTLKTLNIQNNFMDVNIGVSHPLYKTIHRVFSVESQFNYRQTHTLLNNTAFPLANGSENNGKATVSVLRFIQNYIDRNSSRVISLRSSFNVGIDAFDATTNAGNIPDSHYFSWLGQLRYLHNLDDYGAQFFMRGDMQLASVGLLPLERFALGGINTVRGYRQNERVRDEGYAIALELRYPLLPANINDGHRLNIVPFFDIGGVWNSDDRSKTLMSTGIGLQWTWQQFDADFYWASALSNHDIAGRGDGDIQDQGIHFRLHARVL